MRQLWWFADEHLWDWFGEQRLGPSRFQALQASASTLGVPLRTAYNAWVATPQLWGTNATREEDVDVPYPVSAVWSSSGGLKDSRVAIGCASGHLLLRQPGADDFVTVNAAHGNSIVH